MYFENVLQFLLPSNNEALVVKICEANLVTCEYIQNCAKIEITYLIFVTGGARVNLFGRCKFLQI